MKWLITIADSVDASEIADTLAAWGCELNNASPPVALADELRVFEVEGPPNLPELSADDKRILEVHPNSTMSYY